VSELLDEVQIQRGSRSARTRLAEVAILLVAAAAVSAASPISFGAKAGISFAKDSWTYGDPGFNVDHEWLSGLAGGVLVERSIVPYFSAQLELLVVQKGFKDRLYRTTDENPDVIGSFDVHYRLNMLSLNLLGKAVLPSRTYVLAGPRLDFKLSSSHDLSDEAYDNLEKQFKRTVIGLTFGLGQEFRLGPLMAVFVDGQYYLDFGKLYDLKLQGEVKIGQLTSIRNQAFALYAGVRF
jgi:hypothetical protein